MQTALTEDFFGLSGSFVGHDTGIVGVPGGFDADFAISQPQARGARSTVCFARISIHHAGGHRHRGQLGAIS